MSDESEAPKSDYEFQSSAPQDLKDEDLARCIAIVSGGGAVASQNASRGLARASAVVTVRREGKIVAVGAIKRALPSYVAGVGIKSGHALPDGAVELGYIAVDPQYRGQHLSSQIVRALRTSCGTELFATTDDPRMKTALGHQGFEQKGKTWKGDRGELSLWVTTDAAEAKSVE